MRTLKDAELLKTGTVSITGIASSSWTTIKGFLADAVVNKPSGYDVFVARLIAAASLFYILLKIYKLWKSKEAPKE
jgi:hypothetical protein